MDQPPPQRLDHRVQTLMSRIAADGMDAVSTSDEIDDVDRRLLSLLCEFDETFEGVEEASRALDEHFQANEPLDAPAFQVRFVDEQEDTEP